MRTNAAQLGKEFSRELVGVLERAREGEHFETVRDLRKLEKRYVERLSSQPELSLEIRRRVAERLLEEAIRSGCSIGVCRAKLKALANLGFAEIEQKAHWYLVYARGALARRHLLAARRIAAELIEELHAALDRRRGPTNQRKNVPALELIEAFRKLQDAMQTASRAKQKQD